MLTRLTLDGSTGEPVVLHADAGTRSAVSVQGLVGAAPVRRSVRPRPTAHGAIDESRWMDEALVDLVGEVMSTLTVADALADYRDMLAVALDTLDAPALLRWIEGWKDAADPLTDGGLTNWHAGNTANFRAALAAGPCRVNCYGDSNTQAYLSADPRYQTSWVGVLKAALTAAGYASGGTGVVPAFISTGSSSEVDTRKVWTGAWTDYPIGYMLGSGRYVTGTANTFAFTPSEPVDGFYVYYAKHPGAGTFDLSVDGGAATSVPSFGAFIGGGVTGGYFAQYIAAGTLGTHTLTVTPPAAGAVFLMGVEGVAGSSGVRVSRMAVAGALTSYLDDFDTRPLHFDLATPDLSVIALGENDYITQSPLATYRATLDSVIFQAQARGDVMLFITPPPGDALSIPWRAYVTEARAAAADADIPVMDLTAIIASYVAGNAAGYYADLYHLSTAGHALAGAAMFYALTATQGRQLQRLVKLAAAPAPVLAEAAAVVNFQLQFASEDPAAYSQTETVDVGRVPSAVVNRAPNPQPGEVTLTGWSTAPLAGYAAGGATVAASAAVSPILGTLAARLTTPGALLREGVAATSLGILPAGTYNVSLHARGAVGGEPLAIFAGPAGAPTLTVPATLTRQWTRFDGLVVSNGVAATTVAWSTTATSATVTYIDGLQVTLGATLRRYLDGTRPGVTWAGAAHASVSNGATGGVTAYVNHGTRPTAPVLRLRGPMANPAVYHPDGRAVSIVGLTIAAGDYLEIDLGERAATMVYAAGPVRVSRFDVLDAANTSWFDVGRGATELELVCSGISASPVLEVVARAAY